MHESTSESVYVRSFPCIKRFVCMSSTYPGPRVCVCVCVSYLVSRAASACTTHVKG